MKCTIPQRISMLYLSLLISCVAGLESENIVQGYLAKENQFAYQVSLQRYGSHFCGGALIEPDIVLTAAHCFMENGKVLQEPYTAFAGTSDLKNGKGHRIHVTKVYVNDKYQKLPTGGHINDIAVLKLAKKFDVTTKSVIKTVKLPNLGENYVGQTAKVSGYGWDHISIKKSNSTSNGTRIGSYDGKLKYAEVEIVRECNVKQLNVICGRVTGYVKGLCSGDSGGPLVKNNAVIGVISFGSMSCNDTKKPTKYTNVSSYLPLIKGAIHDKPTSDTIVTIILSDFT